MGWHYILNVTCRLKPEHLVFIQEEYLRRYTKYFDLWIANEIIELRQKGDNEQVDFYLNMITDNIKKKASEEYCKMILWEDQIIVEDVEEQQKNLDDFLKMPKLYRDLIETWIRLNIYGHFYEYELKPDNTFTCHIEKKVINHTGDLWEDLLSFVKELLVPISSEIISCEISSDDFGDRRQTYTDLELRGGRLDLRSIIKSVKHINDSDGNISETRIIYKRSIPEQQQLDLDRCYRP